MYILGISIINESLATFISVLMLISSIWMPRLIKSYEDELLTLQEIERESKKRIKAIENETV